MERNNRSTKKIVEVGCCDDGTVVNTDYKIRVIWKLEDHFKKPLQWLIYQLHDNEVLPRHMFQHSVGKTSGPLEFSDSLGKLKYATNFQLSNLHILKVIYHFFNNMYLI